MIENSYEVCINIYNHYEYDSSFLRMVHQNLSSCQWLISLQQLSLHSAYLSWFLSNCNCMSLGSLPLSSTVMPRRQWKMQQVDFSCKVAKPLGLDS